MSAKLALDLWGVREADLRFAWVAVFGLGLTALLAMSLYELYANLAGAGGRRRVRFEPVIKD